uniref:SMB domain-containing protein n=1 Tax=Pavo cristatus TaxID=9049 RepID=A0A8C9FMK1_PAVCR
MHVCHCDYSCQHYKECCPDFNKVCTGAVSCKGRCFEVYQRGRECDCDIDCKQYGKCCPDYDEHCKECKKCLYHNAPTTPKDEETIPEATEAVTTPKAKETTSAGTEAPATPKDKETTPAAMEAPTTPKVEESTPEAIETPTPKVTEAPTTPKAEETTPEATEDPTSPKVKETIPAATVVSMTPKAEETTPKAKVTITPKVADSTTVATEAQTTSKTGEPIPEATDPPTTPKAKGATPKGTERPTTPKSEQITPEAKEAPTTKADSPTTPKAEGKSASATKVPTTPKEKETMPKATDAPISLSDSPSIPEVELSTPADTNVKQGTTTTYSKLVSITDKSDRTIAKPITIPITMEISTKKEITTEKKEVTTPKKDKTTVLKDVLKGRRDTTTVTIPDTTPAPNQAVTTTAELEATTTYKKAATTATEGEATPATQDKTLTPKETSPSTAKREEHGVGTMTVTTSAATSIIRKPTTLPTTAKTDSTPKPREIVTTRRDTTMETTRAVSAAAECIIPSKETSAGEKEITTLTKETSYTTEKETEDAPEKPPSLDKKEETIVIRGRTTTDKKDTIEEMFLVSRGTSKPAIHFQEITDTHDEPSPSRPETVPVEEPEINKPLIQTADLPILSGGAESKCTKPESTTKLWGRPTRRICAAGSQQIAWLPCPMEPWPSSEVRRPCTLHWPHCRHGTGGTGDSFPSFPSFSPCITVWPLVSQCRPRLLPPAGHYYWLLNGRTPPTTSPRQISVGWGIPSPIDAVFSRCNCDGKTFFIKFVFRYPKPLTNGFAGLRGKIRAALPVARYNGRPESVYFIKRDGNMQQYIYRQEPAKKCQRKARITIRYPAFVPRLVIRRRFQRAVGMPTVIQTVRINPFQSGVLRKEIKVTAYWRGLPKVIHSTLSVPNYNKPDGYDYYAFSYTNICIESRTYMVPKGTKY